MKRGLIAVAAAAAASASLMAGCGGSGSGAGGGGNDRTLVLGNVTTRVVGTAQSPVSTAGLGSVVTGIAGANITSLTVSFPDPSLDDTRIAYYASGSQLPGLFLLPPDGNNLVQNDLARIWPNGWGNSEPTWSADGTRLVGDGSVRGFQPPSTITDGTSNTVMFDSTSTSNNKGNIVSFADGSVRNLTTSGADTNPSWWPASRICFESFRNGNSEIYVMNSDGSGQTRLTTNTWSDTNPAWSPDGNRICYVSNRNGRNEIFQMLSDGSSNTLLIGETTGGAAWDPQYSPDGNRICFVSSRDGNSEIYVADATGLNQVRLTNNTLSDFDPTWSPDGSRIAWTRLSATGVPEVWTMSSNGLSQRRLIANGARPYWSPFVRSRTLLGPTGQMGASASGFLFGQKGDDTLGVVVFSAVTPAGARVSALTPSGLNAPNFVFEITTQDAISSLSFVNDFYRLPVKVVETLGTATPTVTGALVTYNATTGMVSSVLPYTANRSVAKDSHEGVTGTYRRSFTGIWDGSGNNLAPNGAGEASIDMKTGSVVSFR